MRLILATCIAAFLIVAGTVVVVFAEDAPPPSPPAPQIKCPSPVPCRVLILTPDEQQALAAPGAILDTAERGKALDLGGVVNYFRKKIAEAPELAGTPPPPAGIPATGPRDGSLPPPVSAVPSAKSK